MGDATKMTMKWSDAWQQLVYEHSPFRAVDSADFQRLLRQLSDFDRLLLTSTHLQAYADEWTPPSAADPGAKTPASLVPVEPATPADPRQTRHVAAIQLQLMEDAFYSLRLDRHANAPDNRGWMNLFRRWATSATFRAHVKVLEATFSRRFVSFYHHYIEGWREDLPIPHPWDIRADARKAERGGDDAYAGITKESLEACRERARESYRGKGIFLDPGLVEAGLQDSYEEPPRIKPGQHGTSESAPSPPVPPPAAGGGDSSKSTD